MYKGIPQTRFDTLFSKTAGPLYQEDSTNCFLIKHVSTGVKFDLMDEYGNAIAKSEVYISESSCLKGIESVRKNSVLARFEDCTEEMNRSAPNPKFVLYTDKKGQFRFRLKARNGEIIAVSDSYENKADCISVIDRVRRIAPNAKLTYSNS